jgi:oligoribonuclease
MKYLSVDIETTGLDHKWCQVLEFAAVLADTIDFRTPVEDLPTWSCRFYYDRIVGQPFALHLNAQLILDMDKRDPVHNYMHPDSFWSSFRMWLEKYTVEKLSFSGKNFGTFDNLFLMNMPRWDREAFRARVIDPGNLFMFPTDDKMPDLKTCIHRAGLDWDESKHHRAAEDARMVVALNRVGHQGMWRRQGFEIPEFGGW